MKQHLSLELEYALVSVFFKVISTSLSLSDVDQQSIRGIMVSHYMISDTLNILSVFLIWRWEKQVQSSAPEFDSHVDPWDPICWI